MQSRSQIAKGADRISPFFARYVTISSTAQNMRRQRAATRALFWDSRAWFMMLSRFDVCVETLGGCDIRLRPRCLF
jgi:hypothetical protein